jgi:hypothetical protein
VSLENRRWRRIEPIVRPHLTKESRRLADQARREAWSDWEGIEKFVLPAIEQAAISRYLSSPEAERELAAALDRHGADFLDQPESFDSHKTVAENLLTRWREARSK